MQVLKSHCHHTKHVVGYGLSFMLLCWRLKLNTVILNCIESVMFHFCNFKSWVKFSVLENRVHSEQKKKLLVTVDCLFWSVIILRQEIMKHSVRCTEANITV